MNKFPNQPIRFTALLTFAFICLSAIPSACVGEPSYNGKPLSEWLLALEEGHTGSGERVEASDAQAAIRQIGTNGIPVLVDLIRVYDKWSAKKVLSKLNNKDLTAYFKQDENFDSSLKNLRELGLNGFSILGTNAESAAPQITKALSYSDEAARALTLIGPKGFSALTNAINDSNASVRDAIIRALGKEGGGDPEVIKQLLVNALKDPCTLIRLHAADILRDKAPDAVIATLMPLLDVGDYGQRQSVADALADYGPAGKSAAPMFLYGNCKSAADTLGALGPAAKVAAPKLFSVFTNVVCGTNEYLIRYLTGDLVGALKAIDPDMAREAVMFWVTNNPLNGFRQGCTTTLLPDGKELIAGGCLAVEFFDASNRVLSSAEMLDPKAGRWTETGKMNHARYYHRATLLRNGKVLVAGGTDCIAPGEGGDLSSAELYDPATGLWTVTGSMNSPHPSERMALQRDGKVLVYEGGFDTYPVLGHELYDPATGTWAVVTNIGGRK
jgi:hypothetical protein